MNCILTRIQELNPKIDAANQLYYLPMQMKKRILFWMVIASCPTSFWEFHASAQMNRRGPGSLVTLECGEAPKNWLKQDLKEEQFVVCVERSRVEEGGAVRESAEPDAFFLNFRAFGGWSKAQGVEDPAIGMELRLGGADRHGEAHLEWGHHQILTDNDEDFSRNFMKVELKSPEPNGLGIRIELESDRLLGIHSDLSVGVFTGCELYSREAFRASAEVGLYWNSQRAFDSEALTAANAPQAEFVLKCRAEEPKALLPAYVEAVASARHDIGGRSGDAAKEIGEGRFECSLESGVCFGREGRFRSFFRIQHTQLSGDYDLPNGRSRSTLYLIGSEWRF